MAENLVINGVTYPGVECLALQNDAGETVAYIEGVPVPAYVRAEASAVVDKALSRDDGRVFRFIAFSDAHQNNDNADNSNGNRDAGYGMAELHRLLGIDLTAFLGDSCWGGKNDTIAVTLEQAKQFNRYFGDALKGETQIRLEGNHDDAYYAVDGSAETAELTPSDMYALFYAYNKGLTCDPDHMTEGYGYQDFPVHKVRVVALNTNQGLGEGGVMEGYQLKWFAETALDMSGKNDWQLMILSHHPLDYGMPTLFKDAVNILDAWIKGSQLTYTTTNGVALSINYDGKNCKFIANFHGHTHSFAAVKMQKYVSGSYVDIDAWEVNIPNACFTRNNQHLNNENERFRRFSTPTTYNKTAGTAQSTSFNLITVCLDKQVIYADNYGAGVDRVISYGEMPLETFTITRTLTNCTSSSTLTSITEESGHTETLTAASGYTLDGATVKVTMGGVDITALSYVNGVLTINSVTGDIVITAVAAAVPVGPSYTNQIPISTDVSGAVFNGTGYQSNVKLSSSGGSTTSATGYGTTGFIPITPGSHSSKRGEQVLHLKNIEALSTNGDVRLAFYMADKSYIILQKATNWKLNENDDGTAVNVITVDDDGYISTIDITGYSAILRDGSTAKTPAYIRFCAPGLDGESIITVNEPIE